MQFNTPILFLVFSRIETTKQVFDRIREIKPRQLFVAADGPRENKKGEKERCEQVRSLIIKGVDWPCEVKTFFRDQNLGCGKAVSQAITWFFEHVEEGIILEDDTLPDVSFFSYCETLLDKYREVHQVKMIGSNNFQNGISRGNGSYYFSAYSHIWGWATWKRTWMEYDFLLNTISESQFSNDVAFYFKQSSIRKYWLSIFQKVRQKEIDTWDYQLLFSIWKKRGVAIIPNINLVTNIGFGPEATHTKDTTGPGANMSAGSINEIYHPKKVVLDRKADLYYFSNTIKRGLLQKIQSKLLKFYYEV